MYFLLPDSGLLDVVVFDTVTAFSTEEASLVTEHEVETGANPTDHVRGLPRIITMTGRVSNTPIAPVTAGGTVRGQVEMLDVQFAKYEPPVEPTPGSLFREAGALVGDAIGAIGDAIFGATEPPKLQVLTFGAPFDRILEIETLLTKLQTLAIPCTVITPRRQFPKMLITSNVEPITGPGHADFQLTLQAFRTVSTAIVDAPKPAELRGAPGTAAGAQAKKPVDAKEAAKSTSLAKQLLDSLRGGGGPSVPGL